MVSSNTPKFLLLTDELPHQADLISDIIQSNFPVKVHVLQFKDLPQTSGDCYQLVILILSTNNHKWAHRLTEVKSKYTPTHTLLLAEKTQCGNLDALLESGADDLLIQPYKTDDLLKTITRIMNTPDLNEFEIIKKRLEIKLGLDQLIGESKTFLEETAKIAEICQIDSSVLVQGETGTGKELCARAIHYLGPRSDGPFIPVNCGGLPDHLLENEVFGHVKGAYTDARTEQKGLVHEAVNGTLFLDEINSLSPAAQIKFLRFIEDRKYKPLGSTKYYEADVRIIAATNADLKREVEEGRFRQDLYYRIKVLSIDLPPLRERPGDIPLLSQHYLTKFEKLYDRGKMYLTPDALRLLCGYNWPGNVRELKNVIEKTVVMSHTNIIRPDMIQIDSRDEFEVPCFKSFQEAKKIAIDEFEKNYLQGILIANQWNVSKAARQAKKDRRSFQRLIRKHGMTGAV